MSLSGAYAQDVSSSQASPSPFAPNNALYRVITEKFFNVLDMERDDDVEQSSANEAAMEARGISPDLDAAVLAEL